MTDLHQHIPRDPEENLLWRLFLLRKASGNLAIQKALRELCAKDILFYIKSFVWQTNPNKDGEDETIGPFITWKFQERAVTKPKGLLWCIDNKKPLVVEKSREMGATWLVLIVKDWKCRFKNYYDSLMMSKSREAVDSSTRQSLFGKLRFIHEHLPGWMHDRDNFVDNKNQFTYTDTGSTMMGFSSTGRAGVSERGSDFLIDEFTQIADDWEVLYRTQSTSKCRIFIATHMGLGTAFYSLTQDEHFNKIRFHWTQHPEKNRGMYRWNKDHPDGPRREWLKYNEDTDELELVASPTLQYPADYEFDNTGEPIGGPHPGVRSMAYDEAYHGMAENKAEMAKDWDINPSGAVAQFYNPAIIKQLVDQCGRDPLWECELEFDEKTGDNARLVPTPGGRIKLWCNLDRDGRPPKAPFFGFGADVSAGTGCTSSCLSGWTAATGEKIFEYQNPHILPDKFAIFSVAVCRMFCDHDGQGAKIVWENHGPGVTFGKTLWDDLSYRRVYYHTRELELGNIVSEKPGWNPAGAARLILHSKYRQALRDRTVVNHSRKALDELNNFKHDGGGSVEHTQYQNTEDPAGGRENHGDIGVADALGAKLVLEFGVLDKAPSELKPPPGSLAHRREQEAHRRAKSNRLYPDWKNRL